MELSELEVEVIEKIKPKDITVASYVYQFLANESQDPQDLHDFLDKEREHLLSSGEFYE